MKKLGIFGGTFSPPHKGHVKSALSFYDKMELDELRVLPTCLQSNKILEGDATSEDRFEMTKRAFGKAIGEGRKITVDDYELKKEKDSYTYLTLEHFTSPGVKLYLLVGSDTFLSLDSWREPQKIFSLSTIVVNRRESDEEEEIFLQKKEFYEKTFGAKIVFPPFRPYVVSSSELRRQLLDGAPLPLLKRSLDKGVLDYIVQKGLYGYTDAVLNALRREMRVYAPKRIEHILSTEKEAARIGSLYGLSPNEQFVLRKAALLHDVTHEKSFDEQLALFEKYKKTPSEDDRNSPTVLHQFTGALVAADRFDLEKEGCAAIACHTTGKPSMNALEMILCLADYIEKTRAYPQCIALRRYFYDKAEKGGVNDALLRDCMCRYLSQTVGHLSEKGCFIHPQTLDALAYFEQI